MYSGLLRKMDTVHDDTVRYSLPVGEARIPLNERLGQRISLRFTGRIFCLECGDRTRTSFSQGHCWKCFQTLASLDNCIVRPHTCHHHLGTCREPAWGESHCFIPHTVYLANSSGLKVGITRSHAVRARWMDQGAVEALPIASTRNRLDCGKIEYALSMHVADKTHWRRMLSGVEEPVDLRAARDRLFSLWEADFPGAPPPGEWVTGAEPVRFQYPVLKYPEKAVSLNAAKHPDIAGTLLGIKGQYLIMDVGVINIRTHAGYEAEISFP
jgi:hypothetical protein